MPPSRYWRTILSVLALNTAAHAGGAALMLFYFDNLQGVSPPPPTPLMSLLALFALTGIVLAASILPARLLAPVWGWYIHALHTPTPEPPPAEIRRRALNLPAVMAAATLGLWLAAGCVLGLLGVLDPAAPAIDWAAVGIKLAGVAVIATFTALVVYWASEWLWQSELPLFFLQTDPGDTPAFRLPLRWRLAAVAVGASAPLILVAALVNGRANAIIATAGQPPAHLLNLAVVVWTVAGGGAVITVILAYLVGCWLTRHLERLEGLVATAQSGNLEMRLPVVSSDELGKLTARLNTLIESLKSRETEMQAMRQISRQIAAGGEHNEVLQAVLERLRSFMPADSAEICVYDTANNVLRTIAHVPAGDGQTKRQDYKLGEGYAGWVGDRRQPLLIGDSDSHAGPQPAKGEISAEGMHSYLGVPLIAAGTLAGTLAFASLRRDAFGERELLLLEMVAPVAALLITRSRSTDESLPRPRTADDSGEGKDRDHAAPVL